MSHNVVNLVRKLPMHKTPKFVLWVLADIADDNGYTAHWASSERIQEETGYSNRAVADSIAYLVNCGVLVVDGGRGKSSKYQLTPEKFNDQVKYDPKAKTKVVSEAHQLEGDENSESSERGACKVVSGAPEVVSAAQKVVSGAHAIPLSLFSPLLSPNIYWKNWLCFSDAKFAGGKYIKSQPTKKSKPKPRVLTLEQACSVPLPDNVDPAMWVGYIEMRHAIKKPPTDNAITLVLQDLAKWGESANESLKKSIIRSWTGVFPVQQSSQQQQTPPRFGQSRTDDVIDVTPEKKPVSGFMEISHVQ